MPRLARRKRERLLGMGPREMGPSAHFTVAEETLET